MSERGYLRIYKSPLEGDSYLISGRGGEFLAWRNVQGTPCRWISLLGQSDDYFRIPPTGIFGIRYDSDSYSLYWSTYQSCLLSYGSTQSDLCRSLVENSWPIRASIFNADENNNLMSSEIDRLGVAISINDNNRNKNLIPGLKINLSKYPNGNEVFHVIVGGKWINDEDRYTKDIIFGRMVAGGPPSDAVTLTIKNETGYTISDVRAVIQNKIAIRQMAWLPNDDDISTYEGVDYADLSSFSGWYTVPIIEHPLDQIIRMTSDIAPTPQRVFGTDLSDKVYYPFSEHPEGIEYQWAGSSYQPKGWVITRTDDRWDQESIYTYNLKEQEECFLRYDYGSGNSVRADCIGLLCWGIKKLEIYGSNSDRESPYDNEWELIKELDEDIDGYLYYVTGTYYNMQKRYFNFINNEYYRHWKFKPTSVSGHIGILGRVLYPAIGRIELLQVNLEENRYRNRPFVYLDQDTLNSPATYGNEETERNITLENVSGGVCDLKLDDNSVYVVNEDTGEEHRTGEDLLYDSSTKYRFVDTEALSGLRFILNKHNKSRDYAAVIVGNGSSCFEIKNESDIGWTQGEKDIQIDELENGEEINFQVRCNIPDDKEGSEEYPVEALLSIRGESDQYTSAILYDSGEDDEGNWYEYSSSLYAFRAILSDISVAGNQIRLKLAGISGTDIRAMFLGVRETDQYNFSSSWPKQGVTFDEGSTTKTFTDNEFAYTDWIDLDVYSGMELLIAFHGTKITQTGSAVELDEYYTKINGTDSDQDIVYNMIESVGLSYLIHSIEVRNVKKYSSSIALSVSVKKKLSSFVHRLNIVPTDIYDAMSKIGITFGAYS